MLRVFPTRSRKIFVPETLCCSPHMSGVLCFQFDRCFHFLFAQFSEVILFSETFPWDLIRCTRYTCMNSEVAWKQQRSNFLVLGKQTTSFLVQSCSFSFRGCAKQTILLCILPECGSLFMECHSSHTLECLFLWLEFNISSCFSKKTVWWSCRTPGYKKRRSS